MALAGSRLRTRNTRKLREGTTCLNVPEHVSGKLVNATVKAIIESTDDVKYQVDFEKGQTALVGEGQIVKGGP